MATETWVYFVPTLQWPPLSAKSPSSPDTHSCLLSPKSTRTRSPGIEHGRLAPETCPASSVFREMQISTTGPCRWSGCDTKDRPRGGGQDVAQPEPSTTAGGDADVGTCVQLGSLSRPPQRTEPGNMRGRGHSCEGSSRCPWENRRKRWFILV